MTRVFDWIREHSTFSVAMVIFIWVICHYANWSQDFYGAHSWRQSITLWNIYNFVHVDFNILNPRTAYFNQLSPEDLHRYEFPIVQWLLAVLVKFFGESNVLYRMYFSLYGFLSAWGILAISSHFTKNNLASILTFSFFLFSPLIFYYSLVPLPDTAALTCSIWYLYFVLKFRQDEKLKYLIGLFITLIFAVLIKLPYIIFTILSIVYFIKDIFLRGLGPKKWLFYFVQALALIPAFLWYRWVMPFWYGNPITKGIFGVDMEWREIEKILNHTWQNYLGQDLLYIPVYLFLILGLIKWRRISKMNELIVSCFIICCVYFIFEFNAIQISHDYYMMPFLIPLYLIILKGIEYAIASSKIILKSILILCIILTPFISLFTSKKKWHMSSTTINQDVVLYREQLRAIVPDNTHCVILNDRSKVIFPWLIRKKGFVYFNNDIPEAYLRDNIKRQGAKYLYSDSREVDSNPIYQPYLTQLIAQYGSVHVYKLIEADRIAEIPFEE